MKRRRKKYIFRPLVLEDKQIYEVKQNMSCKKLEGETSNFGVIKVQLLQVFNWEDKN